jgi:hypothetical protein
MDKKEVMKALSQLQGNAGLVTALQGKLDGLVGMSSGFVEGLHYKVRARVEELGNIQAGLPHQLETLLFFPSALLTVPSAALLFPLHQSPPFSAQLGRLRMC